MPGVVVPEAYPPGVRLSHLRHAGGDPSPDPDPDPEPAAAADRAAAYVLATCSAPAIHCAARGSEQIGTWLGVSLTKWINILIS